MALISMCIHPAILGLFLLQTTHQGASGQESATSAQAQDLQIQCEKYRLDHYSAGRVRMRIQPILGDEKGEEIPGVEKSRTIFFDGSRLRNDLHSQKGLLQALVADGKYIKSHDLGTPVTVAPSTEYDDVKSRLGLVHPRWIGMGFNPHSKMEERNTRCLRLPLGNREPSYKPTCTVTEDQVKGVACYKIEYRFAGTIETTVPIARSVLAELKKAGKTAESANIPTQKINVTMDMHDSYWIAPTQGYALLKCESHTKEPDVEMLLTLEGDYQMDEPSKIWYPKNTYCVSRQDGKVTDGERIMVDAIEFGSQPAEVFTLEGLGLPVDRRINQRVPKLPAAEYFWNGTRPVLIPHPLAPKDVSNSQELNKPSYRMLILGANAIICLLVGIWLLFRRRNASPI